LTDRHYSLRKKVAFDRNKFAPAATILRPGQPAGTMIENRPHLVLIPNLTPFHPGKQSALRGSAIVHLKHADLLG
jgi:hypothetical protein